MLQEMFPMEYKGLYKSYLILKQKADTGLCKHNTKERT